MSNAATAQVATRKARFYFNFGDAVEIEFYGNESPMHVANFFHYSSNDLFNNSYIHRTWAGPSTRFLQGGSFYVPDSPTLGNLATESIPTFDPIDNEFNAANGLSNIPGSLAAARTSDPDSATSGWFINTTNNAGFDTGPYTVFGQVTKGLDFLKLIVQQPLLDSIYPSYANAPYATAPLVNGTSLFVLTDVVEVPLLDGDYNDDGTVNGSDLNVWAQAYGDAGPSVIDGDGDRLVDGGDFLLWQQNFGAPPTTASISAIPEPASFLLAAAGLASLGFARRRRD